VFLFDIISCANYLFLKLNEFSYKAIQLEDTILMHKKFIILANFIFSDLFIAISLLFIVIRLFASKTIREHS
tara:strand:- start:4469 stop:4684 length:216 start_codon:yes stop_codon:yes gene_type:complete